MRALREAWQRRRCHPTPLPPRRPTPPAHPHCPPHASTHVHGQGRFPSFGIYQGGGKGVIEEGPGHQAARRHGCTVGSELLGRTPLGRRAGDAAHLLVVPGSHVAGRGGVGRGRAGGCGRGVAALGRAGPGSRARAPRPNPPRQPLPPLAACGFESTTSARSIRISDGARGGRRESRAGAGGHAVGAGCPRATRPPGPAGPRPASPSPPGPTLPRPAQAQHKYAPAASWRARSGHQPTRARPRRPPRPAPSPGPPR